MLRLTARPQEVAASTLRPGTAPLPLGNGRTGLLHVPPGPVRGLVVSLHGAGGRAVSGLDLFRAQADPLGLVVLAPATPDPPGRRCTAVRTPTPRRSTRR